MIELAATAAFARGLRLGRLRARRHGSGAVALPVGRWLGPADAADLSVVDHASPLAVDIGCGPGRMLHALAGRGIDAVGIDTNPAAVLLARDSGATVVEGSVFGAVPNDGQYRSALLLDGNIGIGGIPERMLARTHELLAPGGTALVEVEPPGSATVVERVRLETGRFASDWFEWARVSDDAIGPLAAAAGLPVTDRWAHSGRWFVRLERS